MPREVMGFHYRKLFGLTAAELAQEPVDQLFTNLYVWGQIQEKRALNHKMSNHG